MGNIPSLPFCHVCGFRIGGLTMCSIVEVVYSAIGALIFSLYIIYDTYNICNVLHPDEYIIGSINLYLPLTFLPRSQQWLTFI